MAAWVRISSEESEGYDAEAEADEGAGTKAVAWNGCEASGMLLIALGPLPVEPCG